MKQPRTKHVFGPGGPKCRCCTRGDKKEALTAHNRTLRRRAKTALREESR